MGGGTRASSKPGSNRWTAGPPQFSNRQGKASEQAAKPAARAAKATDTVANGPGFIEGEPMEQVNAMNQRLIFLLSFLVGTEVAVVTRTVTYQGILDSVNPTDAQSVVLRYAYTVGASRTIPPTDTLVINGSDCLSISGTAGFDHDVKETTRTGFKTDTDISRVGETGERELHRWVPDEGDDMALESLDASGGSWDQFATNERLFGLTTDFDEEIYTTKLDRSSAKYKEREREAVRIAQEIQSAPFMNAHVAEERQEVTKGDDGMDEEDRYGAVLRPGTKYVPPYLRAKEASADQSAEPTRRSSATPQPQPEVAGVAVHGSASAQGKLSDAPKPAPNNAVAAAALAKLNIRMTGHTPSPKTDTMSNSVSASASPDPGASTLPDPAIAALSPRISGQSSKLANLRGIKDRPEIAALNKPMADITEKLNSERERIQQRKQAVLKTRMSELVKFHHSFKLSSPMPDDVAEIVGAKKRQPSPKAAEEPPKKAEETKKAVEEKKPAETKKEEPKQPEEPVKAEEPKKTDEPTKASEAKKADDKKGFKFNAKAASFKPSASATPFVPKAGSKPAQPEYNLFFGRRTLDRTPKALWGGSFKMTPSSSPDDSSPTWPFGSRPYRSQYGFDEPDPMMMYAQQYGMPQGYYGYMQYPYQQPPMMAGGPPRMPTSAPYSTPPYGMPAYAPNPYTSAPSYPSPMMAAGRSPVISAVNGPTPPTAHPLPHVQGSGSGASSAHMATTPEMGPAVPPTPPMLSSQQHMARSGADSPSVMYGNVPPVPMGMVPPMPFNGMQPGYMGPPPPQGYPNMPMPMGYPQYPPQTYGASPPGMVMMHTPPHPDQQGQAPPPPGY